MQNLTESEQTTLNNSLLASDLPSDLSSATALIQRPNPIVSGRISKHHKYKDNNLLRKHYIKSIVSFDSKQPNMDTYWWHAQPEFISSANLKRFKALTDLQLYEVKRYQVFNKRAASSLQYLSSLSTITLSADTYLPDWRIFQRVSACLRHLKSLSTLQVYSSYYDARLIRDIGTLLSSLKYAGSLANLRLNLELHYIADKSIHNLCRAFRHFTSLRILDINLRDHYDVFRKVQELMINLRHLSNLSTLKLKASLAMLDVQSFNHLCASLEHMTNLSTLRIDIPDPNSLIPLINHIQLENLFESLKQLTALKILDIDCALRDHLTNDQLISLSLSLGHLASLSTLRLNFSGCSQFDDKGVETLSASLMCLPLLSDLSLNFSSTKNLSMITDHSLQCLSVALQPLHSLVSLRLDFEDCKFIYGDVFKDLTEAIRHATHLHALTLNFSGHDCSTLEAPDELFIVLGSLVCLVELKMSFSYFEGFTDKSVRPLATSLKQLICLSRLEVDFCGDSVTENFVVAIFENIKSLPKLSDVKMYFTLRARAFRKAAIRRITAFGYFRSLKSFNFNGSRIYWNPSY